MKNIKDFWNNKKENVAIITVLVVIPVVSLLIGYVQLINYYKTIDKNNNI